MSLGYYNFMLKTTLQYPLKSWKSLNIFLPCTITQQMSNQEKHYVRLQEFQRIRVVPTGLNLLAQETKYIFTLTIKILLEWQCIRVSKWIFSPVDDAVHKLSWILLFVDCVFFTYICILLVIQSMVPEHACNKITKYKILPEYKTKAILWSNRKAEKTHFKVYGVCWVLKWSGRNIFSSKGNQNLIIPFHVQKLYLNCREQAVGYWIWTLYTEFMMGRAFGVQRWIFQIQLHLLFQLLKK